MTAEHMGQDHNLMHGVTPEPQGPTTEAERLRKALRVLLDATSELPFPFPSTWGGVMSSARGMAAEALAIEAEARAAAPPDGLTSGLGPVPEGWHVVSEDARSRLIHRDEPEAQPEPLGVPGYAGAKGAVPEPQEPTTAFDQFIRDWGPGDDMEGAAFAEFRDDLRAVQAEARAAAPPAIASPGVETYRRLVDAALDEWNSRAVGAQGWPAMAELERVHSGGRAAAPPDIDVEPTMQDYLRWRDSLPMGDAYAAFLAGFRLARAASPDATPKPQEPGSQFGWEW